MDVTRVSPFLHMAGLRIELVSATRVSGTLEVGEQHHTPWGVVHGGIYTTAVETAASIGASAAVEDRAQYAVGVHNATDFLRSISSGRLNVVANAIHQGRVQQLWDVTIHDDQHRLIARGSLRLQNLDQPTPKEEKLNLRGHSNGTAA
jgi:1,4-dihydroxy-2-naphthoyl-CoA hydrolase